MIVVSGIYPGVVEAYDEHKGRISLFNIFQGHPWISHRRVTVHFQLVPIHRNKLSTNKAWIFSSLLFSSCDQFLFVSKCIFYAILATTRILYPSAISSSCEAFCIVAFCASFTSSFCSTSSYFYTTSCFSTNCCCLQ